MAGKAVRHASDELVAAAMKHEEEGRSGDEEDSVGMQSSSRVARVAYEMQAQEEILRKEKELRMARNKLANIRKNKPREEDEDED